MAPNSSRWWMTAVSSKKLCLYSDKGCRGQIMDMETATDADMVKITLHDGSVRLLSVKRFVPSHEEGCSTFRGISTAATLMETWSLYSGKFVHVPAADQESLDSDVRHVIHVPAADQEGLDSDVHNDLPVKKFKTDHRDRPSTSVQVIKRIVMGICRPQDKIVIPTKKDTSNIILKDSAPTVPPGIDRGTMCHEGQRMVLGDSLCRGIAGDIPNCSVISKAGADLKRMQETITNLNIKTYHSILLHVGTNEISSFNPHRFLSEYMTLIKYLKSMNPDAVIMCCDIIPRIRDFSTTQRVVIHANNIIRHVCTVLRCKHVRTSKRFLYLGTGGPRHYLYCSDGLHLNDKGKYQLKRSFAQALSHAHR